MATLLESSENSFYRQHYHQLIYGLMAIIALLIIATGVLYYQITHKPKPIFHALDPANQSMLLTSFTEPNLLPDTILRWAGKGASVAFNFDFVNYNKQIGMARPFFTTDGWQDYLGSINALINTIIKNQLFVNGVAVGTPVIANQGNLFGKGYVWRVQIPFLVTYQNASTSSQRNYMVILTIVRVPTSTNPQGIGIDQFVMVSE